MRSCTLTRCSTSESTNGVRLLICDLATGQHIYLDPLELEALTRLDHSFFIPLVAPATQEQVPLEAPGA